MILTSPFPPLYAEIPKWLKEYVETPFGTDLDRDMSVSVLFIDDIYTALYSPVTWKGLLRAGLPYQQLAKLVGAIRLTWLECECQLDQIGPRSHAPSSSGARILLEFENFLNIVNSVTTISDTSSIMIYTLSILSITCVCFVVEYQSSFL